MARILIVEDDPQIRKIESDYLKNAGYDVVVAADGVQGELMASTQQPDLIILDLNLPGKDGVEVCKKVRKGSGIPILMVTARTKEIDELIGLEVGADDYIKKPFSPKIMVARVRSLLKRAGSESEPVIINVLDLMFDLQNYVLKRDDDLINLTKVQFDILSTLVMNKGKVMKRDELMDNGYKSDIPPEIFDRTIDAHIKNIRKALGDDPKDPKYISTIRGVGYKFNGE
ncbi:MAG TPA: response regulator transcription factor [Candidatus Dojkabacteria bacterium]|nr:response regulator transcription factor [Candidatus Dojkabacteria bacterium]